MKKFLIGSLVVGLIAFSGASAAAASNAPTTIEKTTGNGEPVLTENGWDASYDAHMHHSELTGMEIEIITVTINETNVAAGDPPIIFPQD